MSPRLTNRARSVIGVTTSPGPHLDHHGRLRILVTGILGSNSTDRLAIDLPDNLLARPIDGIGMVVVVIAPVVMSSSTVVATGIAFSKVVGLHVKVVDSKPLPVDLVQVVRLQHGTADDTCSGSRFDHTLDPAKHDVPLGLDQRGIALLGNGKTSTFGVVFHSANVLEISGGAALGEIIAGGASQSRIGRTS